MALIDVGSDMGRRADSRAMTFLHSAGVDKARESTLKSWGKGHIGRMDAFIAATKFHEQGVSKGIRGQKTPARGIVRENITPKTKPQMKQMGSAQ